LSATATSFGKLLPSLIQAASRQVIALEQQGHGHTADIDRPLRYEQMADTRPRRCPISPSSLPTSSATAWASGVGMQLAIRHPELVYKLIVVSVTFNSDGLHPGLLARIDQLQPENLAGTPFE
jgi:pimeloyl-ACP methyl ester carboxylesterase